MGVQSFISSADTNAGIINVSLILNILYVGTECSLLITYPLWYCSENKLIPDDSDSTSILGRFERENSILRTFKISESTLYGTTISLFITGILYLILCPKIWHWLTSLFKIMFWFIFHFSIIHQALTTNDENSIKFNSQITFTSILKI